MSDKGKDIVKGKVNQVTFSVNLITKEVASDTEEGKDAGLLFLELMGKARKQRGVT